MKVRLIVASLVASSTLAHAQAPGDYEVAPPGMTPAEVAPAPVPERPRRWSVGLGIGGLELSPHENPDVSTQFSVGQLAIRYRPWRHLEIELGLAGGREQLEEGIEGDRMVTQAVLALRYRFKPERRWNWWLMAGMGSLAVTHHEASDDERDSATQSTLQLGVGLERRWRRFAIQAELRAVGVAPQDEENTTMPVREPYPDGMQPLPPYEPATRGGLEGGQFTISGNYYF